MLDPGADSQPHSCCTVDSRRQADPRRIAAHFDNRIVEQTDEAGADFPEMVDVSAMLLRLIEADLGADTPTVLELGCGSGALTVAALKRGATRARGIDLSPGMLAVAVRRAEAAGVAEQASFGVGDGATETLEQADWVLLDRVICCYPDVNRLLGNAVSGARRRVAFSVPTSRGWRGLVNRVMWWVENVPQRFGRPGCPTYVHSLDDIEAALGAAGFVPVRSDRLGLWHGAVWDRREGGS